MDILKQVGAVIAGSHFVGTSGKHFDTYINKDALYPHTKETSEVCRLMAEAVKDLDIDTIVGPVLGGVILSQWVAFHLSQIKGTEIFGVYAEKTPEGGMQFTRGYDKYVAGKKILVVEDLTQTGGSAKKTTDAVRSIGGQVAGVCVMVNKNTREVNSQYFNTPFFPLDILEVPMYEEGRCPLCDSGIPINTAVGHGKKYLEAKNLKS